MTDLARGTIVRIPFGLDDTVEAELAYVSGLPGREHVLVWLSPDLRRDRRGG